MKILTEKLTIEGINGRFHVYSYVAGMKLPSNIPIGQNFKPEHVNGFATEEEAEAQARAIASLAQIGFNSKKKITKNEKKLDAMREEIERMKAKAAVQETTHPP